LHKSKLFINKNKNTMADNFNLRAFLTENKLTKNAKLLSEAVTLGGQPVDISSIEIDGIDTSDYPDFVDAYITYAEYEDGTPLTEEELMKLEDENYGLVGELIHDKQLYLEEKKEEVPENPEDYTKQPGYVHESLTSREKMLVEMVADALSEEEHKFGTNALTGEPLPDPASQMVVQEDDMVQEKSLPEYKNIDELMSNIEHGTNEAAHKYKMDRMKEVAEMLETKVATLEEGEHAEHIDQKAVKQMRKDILALRKAEEKLRKEFEKKFAAKKEKKEDK
jgi:hypothetical protein